VSATLGGILFALPYLATGMLWTSRGLHLAWNFVEHPLLGFPDNSVNALGGIINQVLVGPDLLTGGGYRLEAGLVGGFGISLVLMALLAWWLLPTRRNLADNAMGCQRMARVDGRAGRRQVSASDMQTTNGTTTWRRWNAADCAAVNSFTVEWSAEMA
jgi:hypothetical protein